MKVFVIRDFDRDSYKGQHVGVADSLLVAQIAAQVYARSRYNLPVWLDQEWVQEDFDDCSSFRCFTSQTGETHEMLIQENHVLEVTDLNNPIDFSLTMTDEEKERLNK